MVSEPIEWSEGPNDEYLASKDIGPAWPPQVIRIALRSKRDEIAEEILQRAFDGLCDDEEVAAQIADRILTILGADDGK